REYLAGIDFFVYYDNEHIVEAFGRSILEAMASGCVVILPHKFRNVFGEGALYAEPAEVEGMVRRIHADPAQYAELSARALEHVRRRFSYGAYADRIISLIEGVAGSQRTPTDREAVCPQADSARKSRGCVPSQCWRCWSSTSGRSCFPAAMSALTSSSSFPAT